MSGREEGEGEEKRERNERGGKEMERGEGKKREKEIGRET